MDISHQLCHPLATTSADANKCYNQINHIIMSLFLLAIVGSIGAASHPINENLSAYGKGGFVDIHRREGLDWDSPLQELFQCNGAAPARWLIIYSVLMNCISAKDSDLKIFLQSAAS